MLYRHVMINARYVRDIWRFTNLLVKMDNTLRPPMILKILISGCDCNFIIWGGSVFVSHPFLIPIKNRSFKERWFLYELGLSVFGLLRLEVL